MSSVCTRKTRVYASEILLEANDGLLEAITKIRLLLKMGKACAKCQKQEKSFAYFLLCVTFVTAKLQKFIQSLG